MKVDEISKKLHTVITIACCFCVIGHSTFALAFNATQIVKSSIPEDGKKRAWFSEQWKEKQIDENTYEISVADGVWKLSMNKQLCSENHEFVLICSNNGTAKRYSDWPYCKPVSFCEGGKNKISGQNILNELKNIDLSALSYSVREQDGMRFTTVQGIPKQLKRAISKEVSKFEKKYPDATQSVTCSTLAKKYNLPEKAVKAIYYEGAFTPGW